MKIENLTDFFYDDILEEFPHINIEKLKEDIILNVDYISELYNNDYENYIFCFTNNKYKILKYSKIVNFIDAFNSIDNFEIVYKEKLDSIEFLGNIFNKNDIFFYNTKKFLRRYKIKSLYIDYENS